METNKLSKILGAILILILIFGGVAICTMYTTHNPNNLNKNTNNNPNQSNSTSNLSNNKISGEKNLINGYFSGISEKYKNNLIKKNTIFIKTQNSLIQ